MSTNSRRCHENPSKTSGRTSHPVSEPQRSFGRKLLAAGLLLAVAASALAETPANALWGVMDWMTTSAYPDTDSNTNHPIFRDGNCKIVCHQYQSPSWLAYKISSANKAEITRIYNAGECINLMLYFVSCTHNKSNNTFGYPLNDQFLSDFTQLVQAYKVGGGPLYIQVFPEFEEWYRSDDATEADQYRAKIRSQFASMVSIVRSNYNKAYIGLCFEGVDFASDLSQFNTRWGSILGSSDIVFVNFMTTFKQANTQPQQMVLSTRFLSQWTLPIMFPYVDLWDDHNTPIFTTNDNYNTDAQLFSNYITNWIGSALTAPGEVQGSSSTNWLTNLGTMKSRGLFAFSLYSANWCNKPNTPADPNGQTHSLPSYTVLTNTMRADSRTNLYPITEMEFWQTNNPPSATASYDTYADSNCSSGGLVVLSATAAGQYFNYQVPVTHSGTYSICVGVKKQSGRGIFQLSIGGANQGSPVDLYSAADSYATVNLGSKTFNTNGLKQFTFTVVGKNAGSSGYSLGLDSVQVIPQ